MKTILLSVMGTSPQVLTETLYAIHMQGKAFPDEVYLITSANAKVKAVEWLFEKGQIEHLKAHYNLPDFKFELSHILLMEHDDGEAVFDGREEGDQQSIADSITRIVAQFTADENYRIHASIAGGRKTMAFYMGYAMSMFGREQDVLSHVFVSKEFEFSDEFFFPTLNDNYIARGRGDLNTKNAKVTLAEIPFVRMRNMVDQGLINQMEHNSFSQSIELLNAYKNQKITVEVATNKKCLLVNGIEVKLAPKELAFYLWLSKLPLRQINVSRQFCTDAAYSASYLKTYSMIAGDSRVFASFNVEREDVDESSEESLSNFPALKPFEKDWLQQARSKINGQLKKWLDESLATAVEIKSYEYDTQLHEVRYFISESLIVEHDLDKDRNKSVHQVSPFDLSPNC